MVHSFVLKLRCILTLESSTFLHHLSFPCIISHHPFLLFIIFLSLLLFWTFVLHLSFLIYSFNLGLPWLHNVSGTILTLCFLSVCKYVDFRLVSVHHLLEVVVLPILVQSNLRQPLKLPFQVSFYELCIPLLHQILFLTPLYIQTLKLKYQILHQTFPEDLLERPKNFSGKLGVWTYPVIL